MKKSYKIIFTIFILCVLFLIGCNNNRQTVVLEYTADIGGYIVGTAEQKIEKGGTGNVIVAVPYDGYKFSSWSDGAIEAVRIDKAVDKDIRVIAKFEKIQYIVVYEVDGAGLVIGDDKQQVTSFVVGWGDNTPCITAVPDDGYSFVGWSDGVKTQSRREKDVKQNMRLVAHFSRQSVSLTYIAGKGGKILGETNQIVLSGENGTTVEATPDIGYKFVKWSDTGSNDPVRCDIDVTQSIDATAEFCCVRTDGFGTVENPMIISDAEDFLSIKTAPNLSYKLNNDIDWAYASFTSMFDKTNPFTGIFDGNGHIVKNIKMTESFSLFGESCGTIKNLSISEIEIIINTISTDVVRVGVLADSASGLIENVNICSKINVMQAMENVEIGGLICEFSNGSIKKCNIEIAVETMDSTTSRVGVGGFIYSLGANATIRNCATVCDITANTAAGFCYSARDSEIVSCCATGVLTTTTAAGFCYIANNMEFLQSRSRINIEGQVLCAGFATQTINGQIDQCYADGNIAAKFQASGFIFTASDMYIKDSYSVCVLTVTNDNTESQIRTLAAGFVVGTFDVKIHNCYFAGQIVGEVFTDPSIGSRSECGEFAVTLNNTALMNCHILHDINTFATDVIVNTNNLYNQDITVYNSIGEMSNLVDKLNVDGTIWIRDDSGLPKLIFDYNI